MQCIQHTQTSQSCMNDGILTCLTLIHWRNLINYPLVSTKKCFFKQLFDFRFVGSWATKFKLQVTMAVIIFSAITGHCCHGRVIL